MHNHYRDILERIDEPPSWFDENGVPRYGAFAPRSIANIYAREAALVEVSCQHCGTVFRVALTDAFTSTRFSLSDGIRLGGVEYGDPPNMGCCDAGPTMSSQPEAVLEYWSKDFEIGFEWVRDPRFEGPLPPRGFDPVDAVPDIVAALDAGASRILVLCTSHRNRIDVVRRVTVVLADRGRVLLAGDGRRSWLSGATFEGLLSKDRFGHIDSSGGDGGHDLTLARFDQLKAARLDRMASIVVMSGPSDMSDGYEATGLAMERLAAEFGGAPRIELALAHSRSLIEHPDAVVDASRVAPRKR